MFLQKKAGLGKKSWFVTAASHGASGVDSAGLRRPGRSGSPQAAAPGRSSKLRLSGSESQALSLSPSLSISLSRGSLPESPRRLSPSHQAHHVTRRASDHSKLKAPGRPAPPPRAASLITIVMIHGKLE